VRSLIPTARPTAAAVGWPCARHLRKQLVEPPPQHAGQRRIGGDERPVRRLGREDHPVRRGVEHRRGSEKLAVLDLIRRRQVGEVDLRRPDVRARGLARQPDDEGEREVHPLPDQLPVPQNRQRIALRRDGRGGAIAHHPPVPGQLLERQPQRPARSKGVLEQVDRAFLY
jgi:hypothetical protein